MTDPTADAAKLLPCPHYSGPMTVEAYGWKIWFCPDCRVTVVGDDMDDAKRRWDEANTRPQPAPPAGEPDYVDEAKRMVDRFTNRDWCDAHVELATLAKRMYRLGLAARPKVEDAEIKEAQSLINKIVASNMTTETTLKLRGVVYLLERLSADLRTKETQLAEADAVLAWAFDELEAGQHGIANARMESDASVPDNAEKYHIIKAAKKRHQSRQHAAKDKP